ncbi:MAG: hypothetical protein ACI9D5_000233 [Candidatus Endobugula sp.]|jgi:hypothetical protein
MDKQQTTISKKTLTSSADVELLAAQTPSGQFYSAKTLNLLVYVILAVGVFFAFLFAFFPLTFDAGGSEDVVHWMVPLGIAVMVVFMPLTAISFLHYRLPKKQKEFDKILKSLDSTEHGVEVDSFVVDTEYKGSDYLLPVLFVTLFSSLGFYILLTGNALVLFKAVAWVNIASGNAVEMSFRTSLVACGFAFLGAYVWSIQYIFRRMVTLDLPPGAYYSVATRLVFSSFLILIYSHFTYAEIDKLSTALPVIAFLTGIFPERLLGWLQDSVGSIFSRKTKMAHALSLDMIEGVGSFHKARLAELGIDNVQNLAHSSLVELIIKTPFAPRVIVDWMAQAKLCLEFKDEVHNIRRAGVRSILDFLEVAEAGLLESIALHSKIDMSLLEAIYCANKDEKSIARLRDAYDRLSLI